jgi:tetratricopeptide (TPR) repeat protein
MAVKYPHYGRIYFEIGQYFDRKKDYKEAINHYKKSIEVVPEYFVSHFSIGNDL